MQNSMVVFTFFFSFRSKISLLGNFGQKYQISQSKLIFSTYTKSNLQNSIVMFTFFRFRLKIRFVGKFGRKIQTVCFSWNLVSKVTKVCIIQRWYSLFLILIGNMLFGQIWSKKFKTVCLKWNLMPRLIQICTIQSMAVFTFFC